ncbi:hypothetical protein FRC98_07185 [Lujinxingia vulgaris]|uniref:Outer membrane protein beta-barrel domain-containing protein n=1 Tax=Lujinxingia vulgaris TaxID=2600176 RepID=A0A5C6XAI2_9DELT|nr:hypothetical protein [Lujinxingia vulgaris]TXD37470.1 hypothetical protein FRC98_07185 [Lujinxingia vulgaris]
MVSSLSRALLLLTVLASTACSHLSYQRAEVSGSTTEYSDFEPTEPRHEYNLVLNELNLYDRSGAFCAGMLEAGDRASSRIAEEREMAEEGRMRGEYSWRERHASEYAGIECGGFFRWGSGVDTGLTDYSQVQPPYDNRGYGLFTHTGADHSITEGGLHIGGRGPIFEGSGLGWLFSFRLSLGSMTISAPIAPASPSPERIDEKSGFFVIPIATGITFNPWYLFGLGLTLWGGADGASALANYGEEKDSFFDNFDYGAQASWRWNFTYVTPSVQVGWRHNRFYWDGRTATHAGWEAMIGVDLHWDEF